MNRMSSANRVREAYESGWSIIVLSNLSSDDKLKLARLYNNAVENLINIHTSTQSDQVLPATEFHNLDTVLDEIINTQFDSDLLQSVSSEIDSIYERLFAKHAERRISPNGRPQIILTYTKRPVSISPNRFRLHSLSEITGTAPQSGQGRKTRRRRSSKKTRKNRRRTA